MGVYLKTGFASANATLTNVFDTVTEENATVTFRADATGGLFGLEGAAVAWTGSPPTGDYAYGTVILGNKGQPAFNELARNRPTHMRIGLQIAWPNIAGFTTDNRIKVVQVMCNDADGAEIELCSISFVKTATAYKWRVDSFDGATTTGSEFKPTGFAYSSFQGWCFDIIMKPDVAHVNIGTIWGWNNQSNAGAHVQHQFTTTSVFHKTSTSHYPTKVNVGAVSANVVPSAASEMNLDDISIMDNMMADPGLVKPDGVLKYPAIPRDHALGCSLELDFAQVGLPFTTYAVFGAVPSSNIDLGDTNVSTQIAIDEGAVYMIATTMVESTMPNEDNPASRYDVDAGKGSLRGRGYTQVYTEKYNPESTSLPSVPYWGMNQVINNRHYIVVPPGHDQIVIYNGEFVEMEVYIHRVRFPY